VYGGGSGYEARTEGQFDSALTRALADTKGLSLIHVHLDRDDHSTALARLTEKLSKRV
jgi:indolepyruvate decarboxylase